MGLQHKVPVSRIGASGVLRTRSGDGGRGGTSQWSLAVRSNSELAGGQKVPRVSRENRDPLISGGRPYPQNPSEGMEGRSWAVQHSSHSPTLDEATLCSHPRSLSLPAPRRCHRLGYQCQRKGVGRPGRCEEPDVPQVAFGQTQRLGTDLLPPRPCLQTCWARPGCYHC